MGRQGDPVGSMLLLGSDTPQQITIPKLQESAASTILASARPSQRPRGESGVRGLDVNLRITTSSLCSLCALVPLWFVSSGKPQRHKGTEESEENREPRRHLSIAQQIPILEIQEVRGLNQA